jgi:glucosyl-3-phosphoglycerate synthase
MEYTQPSVATLHDLGAVAVEVPLEKVTVVVPMTAREAMTLPTERVLETLAAVGPAGVVIPLRCAATELSATTAWLRRFDLPLTLLWCDSPQIGQLLADAGIAGPRGKGRDVWLGLGVAAAASEYVVVHDADTISYDASYLRRLAYPLTAGYGFSKAYYARIEDRRLYGRLVRLLFAPLLTAVAESHPTTFVRYLRSFHYPLAGEFAATAAVIGALRPPRTWGLEVGTLADAFDLLGLTGTAQVDLGRYEHHHRAVSGPAGLEAMAQAVAGTIVSVLADHGVVVDTGAISAPYRDAAMLALDRYALDASFNGLRYDRAAEVDQVDAYTAAIEQAVPPERMPAWDDVALTPAAVTAASAAALAEQGSSDSGS